MHLTPTPMDGAWLLDLDRHVDERGWFARAFCRTELAREGIDAEMRQANLSHSTRAGTLRGLHFQYPPADETKMVRVVSGAITDVVVDLRPESPTFLDHLVVELTARSGRALVVPPRCAHGFITLCDDVEVLYLMSRDHVPAEEGGIRFDDPDLGIDWPRPVTVLSARDASFVPLSEQRPTLAARMAVEAGPGVHQGNRDAIQSATMPSASRRWPSR